MSLDAQDWVWEHSRAKGTARIVLLAVADKASGKDCSAYAGTKFLMKRANAARSSIQAAVDSLLKSKELKIVKGKFGPNGETRYSLPKAVNHRRSVPDSDEFEGGPDSGPGPENRAPENQAPGGPESGPGGPGFEPQGGTESGPLNAVHAANPEEQLGLAAHEDVRSENLRSLANALHHAGLVGLGWDLKGDEPIRMEALVLAKGIPAMVQRALTVAEKSRGPVAHVRYFLGKPGCGGPWLDLPTITADAKPPVLRAVSGGWTPHQQPSEDDFKNQGGF